MSLKREHSPSDDDKSVGPGIHRHLRRRTELTLFPATEEDSDCRLHNHCLPRQIDVDPNGKLILLVGDTKCKATALEQPLPDGARPAAFLVCHNAIVRSAPAFARKFPAVFAELKQPNSVPDQKETIRLRHDNPKAMEALLNIIHGHFSKAPCATNPDIEDIYNITVVADTYDLASNLRPWAAQWMAYLRDPANAAVKVSEHYVYRLWISWVLGDRACFEGDLVAVARYIELQDILLFSRIRPQLVINHMGAASIVTKLRLEMIESLLKPVRDSVEAMIYAKPPPPDGFGCKMAAPHERCDGVILGTLIRSLARGGLWPLPDAASYNGNVTSLEAALLRLQVLSEGGHATRCDALVKVRGKGRWATPVSKPALMEHQRLHLETQAKKTGLISG